MASQERAVAVAPVSLQLLTGSQAWLGESGYRLPDLSEGGTGLVGRHRPPRRRRICR